MLRRLMLVTACIGWATGASPSEGRGLLEDLIHPFFPTHKKSTIRSGASSHTGEVVWSGLVMATNAEKPVAIPSELASIEPTLKELFGYNQFEVIGQSRKTLKDGQENWLAASKHFSLRIDAQGPSEGGYVLNLKLIQRETTEPPSEQTILETATKLSKRSPLVIKGPQIGSGQLLLVLVVQ